MHPTPATGAPMASSSGSCTVAEVSSGGLAARCIVVGEAPDSARVGSKSIIFGSYTSENMTYCPRKAVFDIPSNEGDSRGPSTAPRSTAVHLPHHRATEPPRTRPLQTLGRIGIGGTDGDYITILRRYQSSLDTWEVRLRTMRTSHGCGLICGMG